MFIFVQLKTKTKINMEKHFSDLSQIVAIIFEKGIDFSKFFYIGVSSGELQLQGYYNYRVIQILNENFTLISSEINSYGTTKLSYKSDTFEFIVNLS